MTGVSGTPPNTLTMPPPRKGIPTPSRPEPSVTGKTTHSPAGRSSSYEPSISTVVTVAPSQVTSPGIVPPGHAFTPTVLAGHSVTVPPWRRSVPVTGPTVAVPLMNVVVPPTLAI